MVQRIGDTETSSGEVVAAAGEDLELECVSTGANPPPVLKWYMINKMGAMEEIPNGHSQKDSRSSPKARTWSSFSRLNLPVSKTDNGAMIKCSADHPALKQALEAATSLIIHCKSESLKLTVFLLEMKVTFF